MYSESILDCRQIANALIKKQVCSLRPSFEITLVVPEDACRCDQLESWALWTFAATSSGR
jgi:hypothetical protein